jgi:pfkB family carbohydrate kinase
MNPIITLTMNSSVDLHYNVARMESVKKLRASEPLIFPGGGGINVSRVIKELGAHSIAVFTAGGPTGEFLREMLDHFALLTRVVLIEEQSRISATIYETETGEEFRPTPVGPALSDGEWRACFDAVFEYDASYIVAIGSLPVGVPPDFYARVAEKAKSRATRVVLDTSGEALGAALEDAFSLGHATGTATVLTAGSELCHGADVERLFQITGRPLRLRHDHPARSFRSRCRHRKPQPNVSTNPGTSQSREVGLARTIRWWRRTMLRADPSSLSRSGLAARQPLSNRRENAPRRRRENGGNLPRDHLSLGPLDRSSVGQGRFVT